MIRLRDLEVNSAELEKIDKKIEELESKTGSNLEIEL